MADIIAPEDGRLKWYYPNNTKVERDVVIGILFTNFDQITFSTDAPGILRDLLDTNGVMPTVNKGQRLGYLEPISALGTNVPAMQQPSPSPLPSPRLGAVNATPPGNAPTPHPGAVKRIVPLIEKLNAPTAPARRSTLGNDPAALEVQEIKDDTDDLGFLDRLGVVNRQRRVKASLRTIRHTLHLGDQQVRDLKELAHKLALAEPLKNYSQSEIGRAAIDLVLALQRPALLAVLAANREKERVHQYGQGFPRPDVKVERVQQSQLPHPQRR